VGPEQALAQGVLDEIRPAQEVLSRAIEVARDFTGLPKEAYTRIKRQLRGEAIARMEEVIRTGSDPLLQTWITEEGRLASARQLGR
jgi:enoyl-CoA hydratase/carnithine racemase